MFYRILLGIDAIAALVVGYFLLEGLADGSVSSFNGGLWAGLVAAVIAVLAGGMLLKRANRTALANVVLAILAVPAIFYVLFFAAIVLTVDRWN
ncbi:MAG: hypothetical protein R3D45_05785 [Rhizobiaceae bacterium]